MAISVGDILGGLGAAMGGTGPQYVEDLKTREANARQQKMEEMQFRQKAMYEDANAALQLFNQGDFSGIEQLGRDRLDMLRMFPDADPGDTARLTQLAMYAQRGDRPAIAQLHAELLDATRQGMARGFLQAPPAPEEYTLRPGDVRFSGGRPIASVPAAEPVQYKLLTQNQASSMGLDPTKQYQQNTATGQISQVGGGGVSVTVGGENQDPYASGMAKFFETSIQNIGGYLGLGERAARLAPTIAALKQIAPLTTEGRVPAFLSNMFPSAELSNPNQAFTNIVAQVLPQMREPGSGTTSDKDLEVYQMAFGLIEQSSAVKNLTLQMFDNKLKLDQEKAALANRLALGEITPQEAIRQAQELNTRTIMPPELQSAINAITGGPMPQSAIDSGIDVEIWREMTPDEKALFK